MHCAHGLARDRLAHRRDLDPRIKQLVQVRHLGSIMSSSRRFGLLLGTSAISTALSMLAAGLVIAQVPPQETTPAATTPPATPLIPPASDARRAIAQWPKLPG